MIYNIATLGTTNNKITFNDDTQSTYYRITDFMVTGRQVSEYDIKLPEGMGIADFESLMGRVNLVIVGKMYPIDETGFANGKKSLRRLASLDVEQSDVASDAGYVPFAWTEEDGYNKQINLKVEYVDIPEHTKNGLKLPFRLFCKVKYPVILGANAVTASLGSATATTTGNSALPFTLPRALGLTSYNTSSSLYNAGDLPAWPTITIYGPITNPKIINSTTGKFIKLNVALNTTSDSVIISYDQDSVSATQAGNSVLQNLTSDSSFFTIQSGNNNFTLTGDTIGSGAYATISCFPTWPLS